MDVTPIPKPEKRLIDKDYTAFVASFPCMRCHKPSGPPHHVRRFHWGGGSRKPDDIYQIPLCPDCHDDIHNKPKEFDDVDILLCILALWRMRFVETNEVVS